MLQTVVNGIANVLGLLSVFLTLKFSVIRTYVSKYQVDEP